MVGLSDEAYVKLREFLDTFPLGLPATPSGVEIKILKKLFTEEEARVAVLLSPSPEEVSQIAERSGVDEKYLAEMLDKMSRKGLVFRIRREGKTLYNAAPFMIGLYEYSVKKIDEELARLFKEYYETVYVDEMGASNVPGFKVLPIEERISADTVLLPYLKLKELIRNARVVAVTDCICRKEARLNGEGCDYPLETCLSFGVAAEYYIENGMGNEISVEEAIRIIEEADEAGLVHASVNAKHLSNVCNCCPCCCASLKGITKRGYEVHKYINAIFKSVIDQDACIGCGTCVERCPVNAITLEEAASVNEEKCLGCGLCATTCPVNAISLKLRESWKEPYNRVAELGIAILDGKRKNRSTR
ncbi:MAG: 4Fe-4S binding protein [Candidatus Freyarchaeota archaeon]|nr:4Fe-4S binding protein [Candidatus Freyrarchaeum guaymaensis]